MGKMISLLKEPNEVKLFSVLCENLVGASCHRHVSYVVRRKCIEEGKQDKEGKSVNNVGGRGEEREGRRKG